MVTWTQDTTGTTNKVWLLHSQRWCLHQRNGITWLGTPRCAPVKPSTCLLDPFSWHQAQSEGHSVLMLGMTAVVAAACGHESMNPRHEHDNSTLAPSKLFSAHIGKPITFFVHEIAQFPKVQGDTTPRTVQAVEQRLTTEARAVNTGQASADS